MWRPAHGATSRPGGCRPASGYGRGVGRPGPRVGGPLGCESTEWFETGDDGIGRLGGLGGLGGASEPMLTELVGLVADGTVLLDVQETGADAAAPAPVTP